MSNPLEQRREVSDVEVAETMKIIQSEQRLGVAAGAGAVSGVAGLIVWAFALHAIGWHDSWILQSWTCIAVVGLSALAVRYHGRGVDSRFATMGAALGFVIASSGELLAIRVEMGEWAALGSFVSTRGVGDWILFVISTSVGSEIARTKVDPEQVRRVLSWRDVRERQNVAARYVRNSFM